MTTRGMKLGRLMVGAALLVAWTTAIPLEALADNKKEARDKFKEGVSLYKDEKYEEALDAFKASNELYSHPDTLLNIAKCYTEMFDLAKAMTYFDMFVEQKGDEITADQEKEVQGEMKRIGKKVGKLTFKPDEVEGDLVVDGENVASLPLENPIYLESGLHQVVIKDDDQIIYTKQVNIIGGAKTVVDVDLTEMEVEDATIEEEEEEEEEEEGEPKPKKPKKKKKKGAIRIEVEGEETGTVFIDGEEEGETPFETQVKEGNYEVMVTTPDKPAWEGEIPVESAKHTNVKVDFNSTKKVPNVNNPMFWSGLGVMLPTVAAGIAFSIKSKQSNDNANILYDRILELGSAAPEDLILRQNEWVDKGDEEKKAAIAFYVIGGVGAAAAIASIFIFRKEKPAAQGTFDISGISPIVDPNEGTYGLGMTGSF